MGVLRSERGNVVCKNDGKQGSKYILFKGNVPVQETGKIKLQLSPSKF